MNSGVILNKKVPLSTEIRLISSKAIYTLLIAQKYSAGEEKNTAQSSPSHKKSRHISGGRQHCQQL